MRRSSAYIRAASGPQRGAAPGELGSAFSASDYALLCAFGLDVRQERTSVALRAALRAAGFTGPLMRHLIRTSPLLQRSGHGRYRLRPSGSDGTAACRNE